MITNILLGLNAVLDFCILCVISAIYAKTSEVSDVKEQ
jgi:hypothetical protein